MTVSPRWTRFGLGLVASLSLASFAGDALAKDEEGRKVTQYDVDPLAAQSAEFRAEAERKRLEAIERLKVLIGDAEGDRKAEMMLRLGSLYYEQGRDKYLGEMDGCQKRYDECFNTAKNADECDKFEQCDHAVSFDWYGKTSKLYQAVIKGFPQYARSDEATFYLGMTQTDLTQIEEAQDSFKRLVKLYPASSFVPDAYIQIGDYYFDKNEPFPALRAYLKATGDKAHPRYSYAMYKLAWAYYNVEEYGKAIDTMKAVVTVSTTGEKANAKVNLADEALKDLVRFFADAGEMEEATQYFTALGRPELFRAALKRLAGLYAESGKFDQAVLTYRRLINETPSSAENPGYQEEIITAYRKMGQKKAVLDEIRRLRDDYGKASAWWRANSSNPEAQKGADETIEKALRRTATDFDKEFRDLDKAKHPRAAEAGVAAVDAYYVYLEDYKDRPSSYNLHYNFAELLYKLKRYEEAYNEYIKVVDMKPDGEDSRYCAESAIFAAEEMVKKENGGDIKPKAEKVTKDVQPQALSDWEQRYIGACQRYAKLYPKDSKVEVAIYKSAYLLYSRYHFAEAAELFRDVIAKNPRGQNAEFSANLIVDALVIKEDYVNVRETARAFYQQESLGSATFKKEMYDIWSAAAFTVIEQDFDKVKDKATAADYIHTADAFLQFYRDFPDFSKADIGLNNAAAYYYKADQVAKSMEVRHILVEDPKFAGKSKYYYSQVGYLAQDYERLADYDAAAKWFDKLVELYPEQRKKVEKETPDKVAELVETAAYALFSSAEFRTALGDWQGGIDRYRKFLALFPTDERGADVRLRIGGIYEAHKDYASAQAAFDAFWTKDEPDADVDRTFYARLHEGRAMLAQGKVADAHKAYRAAVDTYDKLRAKGQQPSAATDFVAEMMFELAKPSFDAFLPLEIHGCTPPSKIQKKEDACYKATLEAKTRAMVDLEKKYRAILETGAGEWGLAAVLTLGRVYDDMGETIEQSPCPAYLTTDQCDYYQQVKHDRAFAQTEKAVDAYKLALDKSYELNLYNDNAAFATRRLGELRPDDFPALYEELPKPGFTAGKSSTYEPEKNLE
jgi:tetratricopeptide (TPR) repeat protein